MDKEATIQCWYDALAHYQQQGQPHVLATIVKISGSVPRDLQAKMVITEQDFFDTLGGGGLEFDVIKTARGMLLSANHKLNEESTDTISIKNDSMVKTQHYPLGAKLGQCCGGSVTVMFEVFSSTPPLSLLVFGGGHVATALMTLLSELPCQVDWVDNRPNIFDDFIGTDMNQPTNRCLPAHIRLHVTDDPTEFIATHGTGRYILVMTHNHSLDFDLVKTALHLHQKQSAQRVDNIDAKTDIKTNRKNVYIGCIGSQTKAKRFKNQLIRRGFTQQDLQYLHLPIGLDLGGKEPMAVAVSIMAQLLAHYHGKSSQLIRKSI